MSWNELRRLDHRRGPVLGFVFQLAVLGNDWLETLDRLLDFRPVGFQRLDIFPLALLDCDLVIEPIFFALQRQQT